ncbi:hypothetical protein CC86DRAFT_373644 [Ophiobolus disseminans]|uniref:Inositol-pentakisphosphate 2-kinase n=1 Tax=Ophiobolus disseminans TaxID=1469910 RepID=A0A6A6ZNS5_9PLEO|nr:hypothetical protein CC86DRAFT_373644 [Ophiobolus disseminans]
MSEARCCLSESDAPKGVAPDGDALVRFKYLNQGGANVIFKILPWSTAGAEQPFFFVDCKDDTFLPVHHGDITSQVLRVDKGLDKTLRCDEVVSGFHDHVRPLFVPGKISVIAIDSDGLPTVRSVALPDLDFTKHLMKHQGILLYPNVMVALISKAETILPKRKSDANQPTPTNRWGILLPDMSPAVGSSVTIEVKPKWLAQSPTAPLNAVRCRTCAMQVAKPKDPSNYICPLRLLDGKSDTFFRWILDRVKEQLVEHSETLKQQQQEETPITSAIVEYLTRGDGNALLHHLRLLQTLLDPQGVHLRSRMYPKPTFDHNLRLAMTVRDCSLYITAQYAAGTGSIKVDSKLGDLDFKSADKIDDWFSKEEALLKEAAYTRGIDEDLGCLVAEQLVA